MLEDTSFSVTESYLKSLGVNIVNYSYGFCACAGDIASQLA